MELLGPYNLSDPLFQVLYTSRLLRNCLSYMLLGVFSARTNNTVPPFSLICKTNNRSWSVQIGKILSNSSSSHDFKIRANQQSDLCQKLNKHWVFMSYGYTQRSIWDFIYLYLKISPLSWIDRCGFVIECRYFIKIRLLSSVSITELSLNKPKRCFFYFQQQWVIITLMSTIDLLLCWKLNQNLVKCPYKRNLNVRSPVLVQLKSPVTVACHWSQKI